MKKFFADTSEDITTREQMHTKFVRELAGECMVLLENDGTLPLSHLKRIALYGIGARCTVKGGTGSGDVYTRSVTTIEQGFLNAGIEILTNSWLDRYDAEKKKDIEKYQENIPVLAKKHNLLDVAVGLYYPPKETPPVPIFAEDIADTDTAIYVISRKSGEGSDRFAEKGDYYLFDEEYRNLINISEAYKNVIVVLNIGSLIDLTEIKKINGVSAVLLMGQLGSEGGNALVDVLTGKVNPSGKLTDTWAKKYSDYPSAENFSHNNGNTMDEYYNEDIYVGYRYFDTKKISPLYCFGYGKSYTDFQISTDSIQRKKNIIEITMNVKNVGNTFSGREVVQIYYSAPNAQLEKPYQELISFSKTGLLKPGENEKMHVSFAIEDMASYSEKEAAWIMEKGEYILRAGNSSGKTQVIAVVELKNDVITQKVKNNFGESDFCKFSIGSEKRISEDTSHVCHIVIPEDALNSIITVYPNFRKIVSKKYSKTLNIQDVLEGECTVEDLAAQLSLEELATLCVGNSRVGEADSNVIGGASENVPGAAGDTTDFLKESRGIDGLIFADGPAGLRLTSHFRTNRNGEILEENDKSPDAIDYYQYCTAFPIGWSLAQSWDLKLLEKAGDIVGVEMEQFHVDIWLAPAMNIHRNPLCGRNFEYYSEDPLISGKMAAAITRGVQKHSGKGTTLKHFAANNAEDNRYFQNVHVSERALREIYLKGFEIAVKESHPFSIMSSYNLLNGIHAANCRGLLQTVLRDEWGFDGFVTAMARKQKHPPV